MTRSYYTINWGHWGLVNTDWFQTVDHNKSLLPIFFFLFPTGTKFFFFLLIVNTHKWKLFEVTKGISYVSSLNRLFFPHFLFFTAIYLKKKLWRKFYILQFSCRPQDVNRFPLKTGKARSSSLQPAVTMSIVTIILEDNDRITLVLYSLTYVYFIQLKIWQVIMVISIYGWSVFNQQQVLLLLLIVLCIYTG